MRDGVKLFTVVLVPANNTQLLPFIMERTPYGSDFPLHKDSTLKADDMGPYKNMAGEGYIFVFQDMRGKFKSEGTFEMNRPFNKGLVALQSEGAEVEFRKVELKPIIRLTTGNKNP